jgi:hypothetical protein
LWTTEYYGLAVESIRRSGRRIDGDIEGELAQLGPTGYRPLRVRDTLI